MDAKEFTAARSQMPTIVVEELTRIGGKTGYRVIHLDPGCAAQIFDAGYPGYWRLIKVGDYFEEPLKALRTRHSHWAWREEPQVDLTHPSRWSGFSPMAIA
jgi:hypothetical protein